MRIALVHDWLTGMRGGERCLEVFCELFPDAPIYTLLHVPGSVSAAIERHPIVTSPIQRLPGIERLYRYYLPLFPAAVRTFDLTGHDLILSSSHCVAKGVRVPPGTCHISYIFTPMRYVWDQYPQYFGPGRAGPFVRTAMRLLRPALQRWDVASSASVHAFVAISQFVAERVKRIYGREAEVIPPPVDLERFAVSSRDDGYYLVVSAFAPYKRIDLAVKAFTQLRRRLKIVGGGQDERRIKALAGPGIEFLGQCSDREVREVYAGCRALVFPGEEDFGIVPLEAMACGKPVIAYGRGGVVETVVPLEGRSAAGGGEGCPTGVFFHEQTVEALCAAVETFEAARHRFDPGRIRQHVERFGRAHFRRKIAAHIAACYEAFRNQSAAGVREVHAGPGRSVSGVRRKTGANERCLSSR